MTLVEVDRALRKLRLSGMADVLETRLRHAQAERLAPLDLMATLVSDELRRREDRLLARRHKLANDVVAQEAGGARNQVLHRCSLVALSGALNSCDACRAALRSTIAAARRTTRAP